MNQRTTPAQIADAIDLQTDELSAYLNRETGEIEQVMTGLLSAVEDNDDQQERINTYGVDEQKIARQWCKENGVECE